MESNYIGRFAPSPTGPLHYGSLVAALASYLDAKHHHGRWLLRIEDLDPPRESPDAPAEITAQLGAFQLNWDGDVLFQGNRGPAYEHALTTLKQKNLTYPCFCSRKTTPAVYPGTCRNSDRPMVNKPHSTRLKVGVGTLGIDDGVFGPQSWDLDNDVGDFIVRRKDGLVAYQLAVVLDDDYQGVSHVVRGTDLLDSTPRQLVVYQSLDLPAPEYVHVPILVDRQGNKLSKQSRTPAIDTTMPLSTLRTALKDLGQNTQDHCNTVSDLLSQASLIWNRASIPNKMTIEV